MWYLGLHGLTKFVTAVIFVIAGAIVATVGGVILGKFGYNPILLFNWMFDTIVLALSGPTTADQGLRALSQSGAEKLGDRLWAIVVAISIVILLWTIGKLIGWLGMSWKRRGEMVAKRMWPVILVCMGVSGFGYYSWSEQWKKDRAREAWSKESLKSIQDSVQEQQRVDNQVRERFQKEQERIQKEVQELKQGAPVEFAPSVANTVIASPPNSKGTKKAHKRAP